jgi:hypothetical protein
MLSLLKKLGNATGGETFTEARELFTNGEFHVVTTTDIPKKRIKNIIGLAAYRGYDMEKAFFGMINRAVSNGADAIIGYNESAAFHPDGSKYISCYGTAVRLCEMD